MTPVSSLLTSSDVHKRLLLMMKKHMGMADALAEHTSGDGPDCSMAASMHVKTSLLSMIAECCARTGTASLCSRTPRLSKLSLLALQALPALFAP